MKTCTVCEIEKEDECFSVIKRNEDGSIKYRNSWCGTCVKKRYREKHGIAERPKKFEDEHSKECTKCHVIKDKSEYSCTKRNEDGSCKRAGSWCNSCRNEAEIEKRGGRVKKIPHVGEDVKECLDCGEVKHVDEFYKATRGRLGRMSYCKSCIKVRIQNDPTHKERHREYVKVYRETNLFSWRAMHRIHQFNRRRAIKATCDGTMTHEVVDFVYRVVHCYWCKNETVPENRTLEHVQELSAGGIHGISNIRMSCKSCNFARKGKLNGRS